MKQTRHGVLVAIMLAVVFLLSASMCLAQESGPLFVAEAAVCRDVVDRQPVGAGTSFESSVEKLFCFTKITGAQNSIDILHKWYFEDTLRATVPLPVRSSSWRTYSSKRIQYQEIGSWHVDIIGPEGTILKTLKFSITP